MFGMTVEKSHLAYSHISRAAFGIKQCTARGATGDGDAGWLSTLVLSLVWQPHEAFGGTNSNVVWCNTSPENLKGSCDTLLPNQL